MFFPQTCPRECANPSGSLEMDAWTSTLFILGLNAHELYKAKILSLIIRIFISTFGSFQECSGSRNVLGALRMIMENEDCIKGQSARVVGGQPHSNAKSGQNPPPLSSFASVPVEGVYLFTSGMPSKNCSFYNAFYIEIEEFFCENSLSNKVNYRFLSFYL